MTEDDIINKPNNEPELNIFDATTANSLTKTMRAVQSMQQMFTPPPDPAQQAIQSAMGTLMSEFVVQRLGAGAAPAKTGLFGELMNSAFGANLGQSLGGKLPEIINVLTTNLGQKKTEEIIDVASKYVNKQSNPQQEQAFDKITSLDINNSEHVKLYAQSMGMSESVAKTVLEVHQKDILNERGKQPPILTQTQIEPSKQEPTQQEKIMLAMMEKIEKMETTIQKLEAEKIEKMNATVVDDGDRWRDDDKEPSFMGSSQKVSLFNQPIKVDVDEIKGDNLKDSFFKEKPIEPVKEELKQVIDAPGNSSLKVETNMEESKDEITNKEPEVQKNAVEEIKPEVKLDEPRKKINRVIKKKDEIKSADI